MAKIMIRKSLPILLFVLVVLVAAFFVYGDFKRQNLFYQKTGNYIQNNQGRDIVANSDGIFEQDINYPAEKMEYGAGAGNLYADNSTGSDAFLEKLLNPQGKGNNITELFGLFLAKEMISSIEQSGGSDLSGGLTALDSNKILKETKKYIPNIEETWKKYFVSENDLKISSDNGKETILAYVKNGAEIMSARLKDVQNNPSYLSEIIKNNNQEAMEDLVKKLDAATVDFKNLETPSSFVKFQKEQINLLIIQKEIFKNILATSQDPLRALLSTEMVNEILNQHRELIRQMNQKLLSLGITI